VDGVVLGVDGQQGHVAAARHPGKDLSGGNHGLFIGKTDRFACGHGGIGSF